jgi:hypothetical protein
MPFPGPSVTRAVAVFPTAPAALALLAIAAAPVQAGVWQASGALVSLSVQIEGGAAPLFPARDGSGRYYVEARPGGAYSVHVTNLTAARVGVLLAVDGLNAISGEREPDPATADRPGRLYVLDPWGEVDVRGWRTSLEDVRRFLFVDERGSYAARTGRANGKMGWIEAWVYRERASAHVSPPRPWDRAEPEDGGASRERPSDDSARKDGAVPPAAPPADAAAEAFPGTGWGGEAWDPATVVRFLAEARPCDRVVVRYEYAPALRALGLLPPPRDRDRLAERERGDTFARPPAW